MSSLLITFLILAAQKLVIFRRHFTSTKLSLKCVDIVTD